MCNSVSTIVQKHDFGARPTLEATHAALVAYARLHAPISEASVSFLIKKKPSHRRRNILVGVAASVTVLLAITAVLIKWIDDEDDDDNPNNPNLRG